jgi:hypothetical protein
MKTKMRIPKQVLRKVIARAMGSAGVAQLEFQRDKEVDEAELGSLAAVIKDEQQVYTADEEQFVVQVQDKIGGIRQEDFKELVSPDHLVDMKMGMKEGSGIGVGKATTVRPPPPPPT